jgi:hypothetical protein
MHHFRDWDGEGSHAKTQSRKGKGKVKDNQRNKIIHQCLLLTAYCLPLTGYAFAAWREILLRPSHGSGALATGWDIFSDQISPGGLMNFLQKHTIDRFT